MQQPTSLKRRIQTLAKKYFNSRCIFINKADRRCLPLEWFMDDKCDVSTPSESFAAGQNGAWVQVWCWVDLPKDATGMILENAALKDGAVISLVDPGDLITKP